MMETKKWKIRFYHNDNSVIQSGSYTTIIVCADTQEEALGLSIEKYTRACRLNPSKVMVEGSYDD